jgi:glycosyltransferase involved in cell wall biosynthesis
VTSMSSSSAADPQRPLRLVVTNTSRSWGGNEHWALQVAAGLAARGHAVLFLWGEPVVGERVRAAGLPGGRLRLRADADLVGLARLARHCTEQRADALILTRWREYLLGGLAARLARTPLTVLRLGLRVVPRDDLKRRLIFHLADRIIVNAEEVRAALLQRSWIAPFKIQVIPNGLDLQRYRPGGDRQPFRQELGIPPDAPLVVTLGSLTPQKDHDLLVCAAARVQQVAPQVHFAVLGEGFLRSRLEDRVRGLGLVDRFHLVGFREDVRPALAAADLFVLSSQNEGMARVLLEALASGLPVVATDVSGTRAAVEDGRNGLVVPPRDPARLATALLQLLVDPAVRRHWGRVSRRIAEERFDARRMLDRTEHFLRQSLAGKQSTIERSPPLG